MPAARSRYDCIVIGGGHNGLVCASYLARAGRSVLLLEAGAQLGGAAVTREFAPGFHVSACAHLLRPMSATMVRDLHLEDHGLRYAATALPTVALQADGAHLLFEAGGMSPIGGASIALQDVAAYPRYVERLTRLAAALCPLLQRVPPRLGTRSWSDRQSWLKLGWRLRRLGRDDLRELLRIAGMNAHDLMQEHFADARVQGALAFDAVLGSNYGPRSPGSVSTLLYRLALDTAETTRAAFTGPMQPLGGLGSVATALGGAAAAAGVEIRIQAPVQQIRVREHRAAGVVLANGECIDADVVISNADPQATFLKLLGAQHLDAGFTHRVAHLRVRGLCAKLHLALDDLPAFPGLDSRQLGGRLLIAPSLEYLERAFNHSKYGEFSDRPAMEITLPTVHDPSLAPPGRHVLSAVVQYAPYELRQGWAAGRELLQDRLLELLEQHAPGIRRLVRGAQLLTSADIEQQFRITGGHWHHVELALDQFFILRPVPGAAQYRTPLPGLYLCGAGCHPGGGVMGTAGRNAALQILENAA